MAISSQKILPAVYIEMTIRALLAEGISAEQILKNTSLATDDLKNKGLRKLST